MLQNGYPVRREGSQGQSKTFLIALKLAQFDFLSRTGSRTKPLLLLDDIFDKLDAMRVEQIVKLVSGERFGQIFITDTNRDHLDAILASMQGDNRLFFVENVEIRACYTPTLNVYTTYCLRGFGRKGWRHHYLNIVLCKHGPR